MSPAGPHHDSDPTPCVPPRQENAPKLERGSCVGRYVVLDELGAGGMGVVYKAYDPDLNRPIALKLLRTAESEGMGGFRERLLREAQALAQLSHPNVIAVYDVGSLGAHVFIATEFVDGQTLRQWSKQRAHTRREILDVFLAAGEGLAAAHRAGLVHRDFKPDNVVVGNDGRVRVLDFGLVRAAGLESDELAGPPSSSRERAPEEPFVRSGTVLTAPTHSQPGSKREFPTSANRLESPLTQPGSVMGTPRYMAPEQHRGQAVDERADQFSFCLSLHEALFGVMPFAGTSLEEYRANVLAGKVVDPPVGTKVPRWLRQTLLRGLSPEPSKRYPSMAALIDRLARERRTVRTREVGLVALAIGISIAAATVVKMRADARAQLCQGGPQRLGGIWDPATKGVVREALIATGKPFAKDAWNNVEKSLDHYASGWLAMHKESCEATQLRGEQSEAVMTLRMTCLEQRRQALDAVVNVLAQADPTTVERAEGAAAHLAPLDLCADVPSLLAEVPPPNDPAVRTRVAAARGSLARASALLAAGKASQAAPIAHDVLATARQVEYAPLLAEALLIEGKSTQFSDPSAAMASVTEAVRTAYVAHSDRLLASASLSALDYSILLDRTDDAKTWHAWSEAAIRRIGSDDADTAELSKQLGWWAYKEGRFRDSLEAYRHAAELLERRFGPNALATLRMKRRVLALRSNLGQWVSATREAEDLLAAELKHSGAQSPDAADLYLQLAGQQTSLGRFVEADQNLSAAWQIIQALGDEVTYRGALWHTYVALLAQERGQDEDARTHAQTALDLHTRMAIHDSGETLELTATRSTAELRLGHAQNAVRELESAIAHFESLHGSTRTELAPPRIALTEAYRAIHDLPRALASAERTLKLLAADDNLYIADARLQLAATQMALGQGAPVLALTAEILASFGAEYGTEAPEVITAQRLHGEALLSLGRPKEAAPELESALGAATRIGLAPRERAQIEAALARAR